MNRVVTSLRSALFITVSIVIILVALLYSAFRLALPMVPEWRQQVEQRASVAAGVPVTIGSMEAEWWGFGPRLLLNHVQLLSPDESHAELVSFKTLRVDINLLDLIQGADFRPRKVRIDGAKLVVEQTENGGFVVRGFSPKQSNDGFLGPALKLLGKHGDFEVTDTEILWSRYQASGQPNYISSQFNLSLTIRQNQYAVSLTGTPPAGLASSLEIQGTASGDSADPNSLAGRVFIKADQVQLDSAWLRPWISPHVVYSSGVATLTSQVVWAGGLPTKVVAQTSISQLGHPELGPIDVDASASWSVPNNRLGIDHWTLNVDHFSSQTHGDPSSKIHLGPMAIIKRDSDVKREYAAVVESFDISSIAALAQRLKKAPEKPIQWLKHTQPKGTLNNARIAFSVVPATNLQASTIENLRVAGEFNDLNTLEVAPGILTPLRGPHDDGRERRERGIPGFANVSGRFEGGLESGDIHLDSDNATLDWDFLYPGLRSFDHVAGTIHWDHSKALGLRIDWQQLDIRKKLVEVRSKGLLTFPSASASGEPMMTLTAELQNGDFDMAGDFMPELLPSAVLQWLDKALLGGDIDVSFASKGTLLGFPYVANDNGRYLTKAVINNGKFQYHPDWPVAESADLEMRFFGESLSFSGTSGTISGVNITEFSGEIPDLREAQLQLRARGNGEAPAFVSFLKNSPLYEHINHLITGTTTQGNADIKVSLDLPLKDINTMQVSGTITANGVDAIRDEFDSVYKVTGPIEFTRELLAAEQLECQFLGVACNASALVRFNEAARAKIQATATLNIGEPGDTIHDRQLLERFLPTVVTDALHGTVPLVVNLSGGDNHQPTELITLHSNLRGLKDTLPAPLGLDYQDTEQLTATLDRRYKNGFKVNVKRNQLDSSIWFKTNGGDTTFERGQVVVGRGAAQLPKSPGLHSKINLEHLDLDTWTAWILRDIPHRTAEERRSLLPEPLETVTLFSENLEAAGQRWRNTQVNLERNGKLLKLRITGDDIVGEAQLPNHSGLAQQQRDAVITGQFERFHWPSPLFAGEEETSRYQPNTTPSFGLDPRLLPSAQFSIDDLRFGELRLGRFTLTTEPSPTGLKLSNATARGGIVTLDASGRWDRTESGDDSFLKSSFKSGSIGKFLLKLGLEEMVNAESAVINSDFHWTAEPQQMDMQTVDGTIDLYLDRGLVEAIDPGAGRLLGLFNFYSLPRRLLLDFNDVTSDGFVFDKIRGSFTMVDGNAYTSDLNIKAPSANVSIIGRAGVVARDYDQRIVVTPRVSSGLAIAGAALTTGGLGFGAALLLGQEIFGRPLENATQVRYKMVGSWDDPSIISVGGLFSDGKEITKEGPDLEPQRGPRSRPRQEGISQSGSLMNSAPVSSQSPPEKQASP